MAVTHKNYYYICTSTHKYSPYQKFHICTCLAKKNQVDSWKNRMLIDCSVDILCSCTRLHLPILGLGSNSAGVEFSGSAGGVSDHA